MSNEGMGVEVGEKCIDCVIPEIGVVIQGKMEGASKRMFMVVGGVKEIQLVQLVREGGAWVVSS